MTSTTPIETEYNLFYEPDIYNPPGSCVNDFKDIPDLIQYIDEQIQDVYLECNDFQELPIAKDGQSEMLTMKRWMLKYFPETYVQIQLL